MGVGVRSEAKVGKEEPVRSKAAITRLLRELRQPPPLTRWVANWQIRPIAETIPLSEVDRLLAGLGARLRMLRAERQYTLEALAAAADISPAHLSRLESGARHPSLAIALNLAAGLGISLSELLGPAEPRADEGIVVRGASAPFRTVGGVTFQALTPREGQQLIQAVRVVIPVRPKGTKPQTHEGEQWLYVIRGRLRMVLGRETFVLDEGDAANFDGGVPHLLSGEGGEAEILVVGCTAPPSRAD